MPERFEIEVCRRLAKLLALELDRCDLREEAFATVAVLARLDERVMQAGEAHADAGQL